VRHLLSYLSDHTDDTTVGILGEDAKQAFVKELEHVSRDPIPWVRTEASFALGALAKVVPEEVIQCSLVSRTGSHRGTAINIAIASPV
jgi:hypothetical protein